MHPPFLSVNLSSLANQAIYPNCKNVSLTTFEKELTVCPVSVLYRASLKSEILCLYEANSKNVSLNKGIKRFPLLHNCRASLKSEILCLYETAYCIEISNQ